WYEPTTSSAKWNENDGIYEQRCKIAGRDVAAQAADSSRPSTKDLYANVCSGVSQSGRRVSATTGIRRATRTWCSAKNGYCSWIRANVAVYSSPRSGVAVAGYVSPSTSTVTVG